MVSDTREEIWYKDWRSFMSDDRLVRFIPVPRTPMSNQLNAVLRFSLYYGVAALLLKGTIASIYIPLVVAAITYVVYDTEQRSDDRTKESLSAINVVRDARTRQPCVAPSADNPFMNVLMSDYSQFANRPAACDVTSPTIQERAEVLSAHNLYKDSDDIYDRNASSRQFYTNPSTTIPNDQGAFARWLYHTPPTCKEGNGDWCATRIHKFVPGT